MAQLGWTAVRVRDFNGRARAEECRDLVRWRATSAAAATLSKIKRGDIIHVGHVLAHLHV
jgi:hypothetical protein